MKFTHTDLSPSVRQLLQHVRGLDAIQPSKATTLIHKLAYARRLALLAGREGSGKSTLLRAAIAAASRGQDWLDPAQTDPAGPRALGWRGTPRGHPGGVRPVRRGHVPG